jgi:hypothetical protein
MGIETNTDILKTHGLAVLDEGDSGVTVRGIRPQWYASLARYYEQHDLPPLGAVAPIWVTSNSGAPRTQTLRFPAGTYKQVRALLECWHVPHWL